MAASSPSGAERRPATGVLPVGVAAFAVLCCAGLPLVLSFVGGLTLAAVLGVGAGLLVAAAAAAAVVVAVRARRRQPPAGRSTTPEAKR